MRYNTKYPTSYVCCAGCLSEVEEVNAYEIDGLWYCDNCTPEDDEDYEDDRSDSFIHNY